MAGVEMVWVVSFGVRIKRGIARLRSKRRLDWGAGSSPGGKSAGFVGGGGLGALCACTAIILSSMVGYPYPFVAKRDTCYKPLEP